MPRVDFIAKPSAVALGGGAQLWPGFLTRKEQKALIETVFRLTQDAPFFRPAMPRTGKPFSVEMTNLGPLGWVSDAARGYRYEARHPATQAPWPPMPEAVLMIWNAVASYSVLPEACLVNLYRSGARMGLHVDADEAAIDAPVVSISLGDDALFRLGGPERQNPTRSFWLRSGDVMMLAGKARHWYHGIDRLRDGSSDLVPGGGRINLTLRRVTILV